MLTEDYTCVWYDFLYTKIYWIFNNRFLILYGKFVVIVYVSQYTTHIYTTQYTQQKICMKKIKKTEKLDEFFVWMYWCTLYIYFLNLSISQFTIAFVLFQTRLYISCLLQFVDSNVVRNIHLTHIYPNGN